VKDADKETELMSLYHRLQKINGDQYYRKKVRDISFLAVQRLR